MVTSEGPVLELGEGFSDDTVSVLVDDQVVWRGSGVSTNYSIGLADVVRLPEAATPAAVVEVRARGSVASSRLGASEQAGVASLRAVLGPEGTVALRQADVGDVF